LSDVIPLNNAGLGREEILASLGEFAASMGTKDRTLSAILSEVPGEPRQVSEEVPFSSEYKWSALRYTGNEQNLTYVLGAPDVLSAYVPSSAELMREVKDWTVLARRVLLYARYQGTISLSGEDGTPQLPDELEPFGLVVFQEELRADARQTLDHFSDLGVKIKIISGDHPETVAALALQVGMEFEGVLSGMDLEGIDQSRFEEVAEEVTIFGRIKPQQKERLIEIYRQHGYYTAMIGDGVNDIPPLKGAHLGIAMQSGAPASRSIADIVLLEDRFSALPAALREGQRIVRGMQDVIRLLLTRTFYVFLLIVATQIASAPFPVTPKHNALIAMLTVGIPILATAAWARAGKPSSEVLGPTLRFVFPAAFTISFLVGGIYLVYLGQTKDAALARTILTSASIFCGLLLLPFVEPPNSWWVAGDEFSGDPRPSLLAIVMLVLYGLVMGVPALRDFFELVPLRWWDYLIITGLVCVWALLQRMIWRAHLFERLLGFE
jgi:cation-transporting ATPase E